MPADIDQHKIEDTSHYLADERGTVIGGTRTPRPYCHDGEVIQQDGGKVEGELATKNGHLRSEGVGRKEQVSIGGSDSGTEADDERPHFVKSLPTSQPRLRKGLLSGEPNADVLLTPAQLDDDGRRLSIDSSDHPSLARTQSTLERRAEDDRLQKVRLSEFLRRSSEVAFMLLTTVCVLRGKGVLPRAYEWRRELVSHIVIISTLVLIYPVKLSIVDSSCQAKKLLQRFRVPASFDPATVLYPTLLPILVGLSVSSADPAPILPNIILGLSSLPQRLFPRSSRLGNINVVHWFVATIPLLLSEITTWPSELKPGLPYMLKSDPPGGLPPETLMCLYPLHQLFLQPLHYLTTTSLLISELHLLSAALINLLLLAHSPQANILKACLWIGGVSLFTCSSRVLHWNIMLMRIPKWKFRRKVASSEDATTISDALRLLVGSRTSTAFSQRTEHEDSDADEDQPETPIKQHHITKPLLRVSSLKLPQDHTTTTTTPKSAVEPRANDMANGTPNGGKPHVRPRSSTLPIIESPIQQAKRSASLLRAQSTNVSWCLKLTFAQAQRRLTIYAAFVYLMVVAVILVPVRYYVSEKALNGQEPIGWAVGYLFGQLDLVRSWVYQYDLEDWIAVPTEPAAWPGDLMQGPVSIPALRSSFGPANVRLLLISYWAPILLIGLLAVFSLTTVAEVDTRRKVFHGVMVAMMLPSTFIDPCACALALTLILAVFLLLEVIRAGQVSPLGEAIGRFVAPYVDGRDLRGPVVISHLFLLIGCAVPLWFSLASIAREGDLPWKDWDLLEDTREVAMVAGVVCVGMGDAAASLIGRRYGRHKWIWVGGKSIEGSAAFVLAVTIGLTLAKVWLVLGGWNDFNGSLEAHSGRLGTARFVLAWLLTSLKAFFCACGASFMEAILTGANDNVVVPVALWLLVKGTRL